MTQKHSFLPPSGASSWSRCALWPTMNARFPEANMAESEEGTAAHWVLSVLLSGQRLIGQLEGELAPNGVAITDEMIDGARLAAETALIRIPKGELHIEEVVHMPAIHPECFGTPDIWAATADHLEIIDYKFGHRFVEEYFNPQGLLYMLGILGGLKCAPMTVSFTIVQPRCYYRGEPVRTHTYKVSEAQAYLPALRRAAENAYHRLPLATTGSQCEHCPGRHACPTLQKAAFSDAETSTDQQPVELTPEAAARELRMLDRALSRLTARVDGLKEQTLANIKAGKRVPHYQVENGRGRRVWKVPVEEVIALGEVMGKPLAHPKVISPTQASKLSLDDKIIARYTDIIPGGLRLVESNNSEATRVFKSKET